MSGHSENYGNHWETQMNMNTDLKDCQTDTKNVTMLVTGERSREDGL